MPNDFQKKQPSKTDRILYDVVMQLQDIDRRLWSTSSNVLALGLLLNVDPKKLAELLTGDSVPLKEYADKVNEQIKLIEEARAPKQSPEEPTAGEPQIEEVKSDEQEAQEK